MDILFRFSRSNSCCLICRDTHRFSGMLGQLPYFLMSLLNLHCWPSSQWKLSNRLWFRIMHRRPRQPIDFHNFRCEHFATIATTLTCLTVAWTALRHCTFTAPNNVRPPLLTLVYHLRSFIILFGLSSFRSVRKTVCSLRTSESLVRRLELWTPTLFINFVSERFGTLGKVSEILADLK